MRQAGTITRKRKRWYIVYRTPAGKQKWEGGFETKGQAQNRLTEVLAQIQTGGFVEPSEMTFEVFADQWLKNRVNVRASSSEGYESYLKQHVKPELGKLKLKDIRHSHIQALIATLTTKKTRRGTPLKANTIRKVVTMLKTVFKSAVKNDLIRVNPATDLETPTVIKAKINPPGKEDVLAILRQAPVDYQTIFLLDAVTGLRRGEVLALKWKDLDWINREIIVERAIGKIRATDGAHKYAWAIGPTKSGRQRRVGIPPVVIQALEILRSSSSYRDAEDFIFTRDGNFIDPEYFSKWIALPLIKEATEGRVKRFHDLRHFFASVLIENQESPKYIQDQLGHASITMTYDTYGHLMPQAKQQATRKLERSIFGKKANVRRLLEHSPKKVIPETVN
jgi:integrase